MQADNKQSGFSVIEVLIALGIIVTLALSGWFFWQRSQNNTEDARQQSPSKNEQQTAHEPETRYLVIQEWGVKLPLSDPISGAYYKGTVQQDGSPSSIALYDAGFDALINADGESCDGYMFFAISRARTEDVPALTDPNNPSYSGPSGSYKQFSFSDEYQFSGLGQHQSGPSCLIIEPDSDEERESDRKVMEAVNSKEQAFEAAFDQLQSAN